MLRKFFGKFLYFFLNIVIENFKCGRPSGGMEQVGVDVSGGLHLGDYVNKVLELYTNPPPLFGICFRSVACYFLGPVESLQSSQ